MICNRCGKENAGWRSYCSQCGGALGLICRCSFANQPGDLFCGGCGQPLKDSKLQNESDQKDSNSLFSVLNQLSESKIRALSKESSLLKFGEKDKMKQDDIDNIFGD